MNWFAVAFFAAVYGAMDLTLTRMMRRAAMVEDMSGVATLRRFRGSGALLWWTVVGAWTYAVPSAGGSYRWLLWLVLCIFLLGATWEIRQSFSPAATQEFAAKLLRRNH